MLGRFFKSFAVYAAVVALAFANNAIAEQQYAATEAIKHVGERATVCGTVASTRYARSTRGRPTFINLDRAYPDQVFTVLVWGDQRPKFRYAPETLKGQRICVTGSIQSYRGTPEIIAGDPSQIKQQ